MQSYFHSYYQPNPKALSTKPSIVFQVLGRRRMQSYDHSYHSGALAAHNMATGGREAYRHLPVITSSGGPMGMDVSTC